MKNSITNKTLISSLCGLAFCIGTFNVHAVTIKGAPSCSAILDSNEQIDRNWILGYLSALAATSNKDFLKEIDTELIRTWIDDYCRDNPKSIMPEGLYKLSVELIHKKNL